MDYIPVTPSASCLIESLRDIGYSMETAVADIIDNSITANSTIIKIDFSWNEGAPWISIFDNGHGMSEKELINAMRFLSRHVNWTTGSIPLAFRIAALITLER